MMLNYVSRRGLKCTRFAGSPENTIDSTRKYYFLEKKIFSL